MRLQGRRALVTGGARGIGRAIAEAYVAEGASVAIADRSPTTVTTADGIRAKGFVADLSVEQAVAGLVSAVEEECGGIDILVTSHGILTQSPLEDMSLAEWEETLRIDLTSVFLLCRAVLPGMRERSWGRIVNVASQLGQKGGASLAHYSAAKAGVIAMSKSLALEVSTDNVLVNCIAPGPIDTEMVAGIDEEWKRCKRAELPLGRFGSPEEVAPAAVLLAADPDGNLFVGQTLGPNSGDVMP